MFKIGDIVNIIGYGPEEYYVAGFNDTKILIKACVRITSGWIESKLLILVKSKSKPSTEIEFLDAFKFNFKNGV